MRDGLALYHPLLGRQIANHRCYNNDNPESCFQFDFATAWHSLINRVSKGRERIVVPFDASGFRLPLHRSTKLSKCLRHCVSISPRTQRLLHLLITPLLHCLNQTSIKVWSELSLHFYGSSLLSILACCLNGFDLLIIGECERRHVQSSVVFMLTVLVLLGHNCTKFFGTIAFVRGMFSALDIQPFNVLTFHM